MIANGRAHDRFQPRAKWPFVASAGRLWDPAKNLEALVFEDKGASLAMHYRLAPSLGGAVHAAVHTAARHLGEGVEVQGGKMVAELQPSGRDKGIAIEEFTREPPFKGRVPVFLGDDLTDEHGFRLVNDMGGESVKVGEGESEARFRLEAPAAVRAWLAHGLAENAARR